MVRTTLAALIAASVLMAVNPLAAEETPATLSIVTGLAPSDLLNVRASASAFGIIMARLPSGSSLRNFGCSDVNGYKWCKVEDVANPGLTGWVPERYLRAAEADEAMPEMTMPPAGDAEPAQAGGPAEVSLAEAPAQPTAEVDSKEVQTGDAPAADMPAATGDRRQDRAARQVPPDLTARLGGGADRAPAPDGQQASAAEAAANPDAIAEAAKPFIAPLDNPPAQPAEQALAAPDLAARTDGDAGPPPAPGPKGQQKSVVDIGNTAIEDAYGLAFASGGAAARVEAASILPDAEILPADAAIPLAGEAATPPVVEALPTPRPDIASAPVVDTQTVAQVQPLPVAPPPAEPASPTLPVSAPAAAPVAYDATGEIPCARYIGQPMTRCEAGVVRTGEGVADVTVTWPDGGTRIINFYGEKPAGTNSRSEFRFTREGSLNMIRIGISERFEIPDSLAFGD